MDKRQMPGVPAARAHRPAWDQRDTALRGAAPSSRHRAVQPPGWRTCGTSLTRGT